VPVTRVKICGCRTPADALAAADAGADFIGLVFDESRRRVSVEDAAEIVRALGSPLSDQELASPPALFRAATTDLRSWFEHGADALDRLLARKRPLTVGVFARAAPGEINAIADETGIDLIQLAGGEPWSACLVANRQVIKVVHVADAEPTAGVLQRIETGAAIAVLLDKQQEADNEKQSPLAGGGSPFGGSGAAFDWRVAAGVGANLPVWLAGGLTPANVASAIASVKPWCVDVSSGVETEGYKDHAKIRDFLAAAKASR
jgi:phosphoribosylanthranilate isomerase